MKPDRKTRYPNEGCMTIRAPACRRPSLDSHYSNEAVYLKPRLLTSTFFYFSFCCACEKILNLLCSFISEDFSSYKVNTYSLDVK